MSLVAVVKSQHDGFVGKFPVKKIPEGHGLDTPGLERFQVLSQIIFRDENVVFGTLHRLLRDAVVHQDGDLVEPASSCIEG